MTPESWQRLGVLFNAASELRPADRRAFLERECAGDIDLLAHVLELLDHDHKSDRDGSLDGGSRRSGPYWSDSGPVLVRPTGHVKAVLSLGSGLLPTGDFEELLRQRLYVCGWILLMGSSVFLAKNVWDASLIRSGFDAILCSRLAVLLTACLVIVIVRSHPNLAEQASGGSILDARSDIYSLGCVGYFALTGRPVFDGDSMGQLIAAHLTKDPPDLTGIRSDVPHDLAAVVHRCLAKNPADRFTDVSALERTLGHCECAADWSPEAAAAWWRTTIEAGETPEQSQPASTASFSSEPQ
jgi:hypothetical protein